jgi:HD superfamily phosphohydrolase
MSEYTAFTKYLPGVDSIPFFYRMQFLRQLSTVAVTRHLGATHTRLSHSIGTTKVAALMLEWIQKNAPDPETQRLTPFDITATLFYCFIHDAFHGAFGHVLDLMKDVFEARPVEKLDTFYLKETLRAAVNGENDPVAKQLIAAADACTNNHGLALLQRVMELVDPVTLKRTRPGQFFLRELISSVIDADRIDYLIRDSFYLEGHDHRKRFEDLISTARAVPYERAVRLAFNRRQKQTAEWALGLRRQLYTKYYEAVEKLVVDDMLCHGIYYILRDKGLVSPVGGTGERTERRKIFKSLLLLTDDDFLAVLTELKAQPRCYELITRFHQRRFYIPLFAQGIRLDQFEHARSGVENWHAAVNQTAESLAHERGEMWYPDAAEEVDIQRFEEASAEFVSDLPVLIFGFQFWLRNSFTARHEFERRVWARVATRSELKESVRRFAREEFGSVDEITRFDDFPPIHVTTTSFFGVLSKEDLVHHSKEGSQPVSELLLYEENVAGAKPAEIVPEIREDHEAYPLVLSVPKGLLNALGADPIREAFFAELRSCRWLWTSQQQRGPGRRG